MVTQISNSVLSPAQIYECAKAAGFPSEVAVTMTAIALRESGGNSTVLNNTPATGDRSYGLWQINMASPKVAALAIKIIPELATPDGERCLLDPVANATIAHALWGSSNHNLDIAWYICGAPAHDDSYRLRYESHLPAAQRAALGL
jgi:hypothetical protein